MLLFLPVFIETIFKFSNGFRNHESIVAFILDLRNKFVFLVESISMFFSSMFASVASWKKNAPSVTSFLISRRCGSTLSLLSAIRSRRSSCSFSLHEERGERREKWKTVTAWRSAHLMEGKFIAALGRQPRHDSSQPGQPNAVQVGRVKGSTVFLCSFSFSFFSTSSSLSFRSPVPFQSVGLYRQQYEIHPRNHKTARFISFRNNTNQAKYKTVGTLIKFNESWKKFRWKPFRRHSAWHRY